MAEWYESPTAQDELMRQKLMGMNLPPEQIEMIMMQIKQAEGLQGKMALTENIPQPIGQEDTLQAQQGYGGPPNPGLPDWQAPPGGEMLGDLAPGQQDNSVGAEQARMLQAMGGAGGGASADPAVTPEAQQAGLMERLGPEGLEIMLNQGGIDEQRDQAQLLRNKEGPQGIGGIGRMNTYVAANPLSHLASGVEKHRAKKDIKRLRKEEKEGNKTMLELLRGLSKSVDTEHMSAAEIRKAEGWDEEDPDVGLGIGGI